MQAGMDKCMVRNREHLAATFTHCVLGLTTSSFQPPAQSLRAGEVSQVAQLLSTELYCNRGQSDSEGSASHCL